MLYKSKIRDIIKQKVLTTFTHPTAEDVFMILTSEGIKTSFSTVYRNLHQLAEEKIIKEIVMPDGTTHYDGRMTNHQHAICVKCGKIYDLMYDFKSIEDIVNNEINMAVIDQMIIIRGICENCKNK